MYRILVIDDDKAIRQILHDFFAAQGFEVVTAENGQAGLELLSADHFDLFFVDLRMPVMGGLDLLREVQKLPSRPPAIVITGHADVQSAVDAMRLGAFDYSVKPFNLDELFINVTRALSISKLERENLMLKQQLKGRYGFQQLIGDSPQMQKVYALIERIADTDSTVVIYGESGTGKEVVAKTIHYNSSRAQNPFVPINCAAIPKDLLESELFGHEKGAFTGAISTRIGRFEIASSGTIFLDEIGELHPSLQVKLLRVLQEREIERVGGSKTIKIDVRVIASTNRDLEKAMREGAFREDLFYRLHVIPFNLPPLRERVDDIPLLMGHFMKKYLAARKRIQPLKIHPDTMEFLVRYRWPGNVRELENLVERFVILNESGTVMPDELPERFTQSTAHQAALQTGQEFRNEIASQISLPPEGLDLNGLLDAVEDNLLLQALERTGGVKKRAAALLGLNRTTFLEKLKKKKIAPSKHDRPVT